MKTVLLYLSIFFLFGLNQTRAEMINPGYHYSDSTVVKGDSIKHFRRFFIDKNGDGYNDNAPDHDNDGIPNGLDKDYKGKKFRWGRKFYKQDSISNNERGRMRFKDKNFSTSISDSLKTKGRKTK